MPRSVAHWKKGHGQSRVKGCWPP